MKTFHSLFSWLALTFVIAVPARAKPLSYVGGTMVMQENDETGYTVSVDYMCAFCATGIEKTLRKQPEVATVKVDLHKKLVTITTKPGKTLSDAKIKEVITYSEYTMGNIVREKQ